MDAQTLTIAKTMADIVRKHAGSGARVVLFGSRARCEANPRSDYDIGVDAGAPLPLATEERILAELDVLPVLQKIDLVDLRRASQAFCAGIGAEGVEL